MSDPIETDPSQMVSLVEEEISSGTPTTYKPSPATTIDPQSFHPIYKVYFVPPVGVISKCPPNSRLFIGNLAVERVDAKDIASVFVAYGNIYEISIKSSFGFVQFDSADACEQAIANEQGRLMGGLKLDLKISKERAKGARGKDGKSKIVDRRKGGRRSPSPKGRRPRSPSPRYGRSLSRERKSRNSPRRSPSPPATSNIFHNMTNEYPLPRRYGSQIPECLIIVLQAIDRKYITHVENMLRDAKIHFDTLHFSPNLSLRSVVQQVVVEGARAVLFLEQIHERTRSVSLQTFKPDGTIIDHEEITVDRATNIIIRERSMPRPTLPGAIPSAQPSQSANIATILSSLASGGADAQTILTVANALQQQQPQIPVQQPIYRPAPVPMVPNPAMFMRPAIPAAIPMNMQPNGVWPHPMPRPMVPAIPIVHQQAQQAPASTPQSVGDILSRLKELQKLQQQPATPAPGFALPTTSNPSNPSPMNAQLAGLLQAIQNPNGFSK